MNCVFLNEDELRSRDEFDRKKHTLIENVIEASLGMELEI